MLGLTMYMYIVHVQLYFIMFNPVTKKIYCRHLAEIHIYVTLNILNNSVPGWHSDFFYNYVL